MKNSSRSMSELVAERRRVAAQAWELNKQLEALNGQLEVLDIELFARLDAGLSAFGGSGLSVKTQPTHVLEVHRPIDGRFTFRAPQSILSNSPVHVGGPVRHGELGVVIQDLVRKALKEAKKPLKTKELTDALEAMGFAIPGNNPQNNLSAHLSRSEEFVSGRDGWWFREPAS
ncbi:hypothetical protein [Lysobacter capsici]|uniref:hypothetical protein n=1 Tax=Lysobacter capsici TaxID=435897 RepID=UPI00128FE8EF|nr:hypothetical protein [Lysobacter capsici]